MRSERGTGLVLLGGDLENPQETEEKQMHWKIYSGNGFLQPLLGSDSSGYDVFSSVPGTLHEYFCGISPLRETDEAVLDLWIVWHIHLEDLGA